MKTDSIPARVTPRRIKGATWGESITHLTMKTTKYSYRDNTYIRNLIETTNLLMPWKRTRKAQFTKAIVKRLTITVVGRGIPAARPHAETVPLCFIWVGTHVSSAIYHHLHICCMFLTMVNNHQWEDVSQHFPSTSVNCTSIKLPPKWPDHKFNFKGAEISQGYLGSPWKPSRGTISFAPKVLR